MKNCRTMNDKSRCGICFYYMAGNLMVVVELGMRSTGGGVRRKVLKLCSPGN